MRSLLLASLSLALSLGACSAAGEVSSGDLTVRARDDGSFDVVVGGRTLLAGAARPITLRQFDPAMTLLFGQFDYNPGPVKAASVDHPSALRLEGDVIRLALEGEGAGADVRVSRVGAGEVLVEIRGRPSGSLKPRGMALRFQCTPEARFLGFGEQYQKVEHRGEVIPLWVSEQGIGRDPQKQSPFSGNPFTTYFPVPFFLDPRGFGLAVDTDERVEADLCATDPDVYTLTIDEPQVVRLHLYSGPTPADVVAAFTGGLQGRAASAPRWAVDGVWIGVQGGPDRIRQTVASARAAGVPLGAVWVQDWVGRLPLGGGLWEIQYHWTADTTLYPDLPGLISELKKGPDPVHWLGYFNPFINPKYDQWNEAVAKDYVIRDPDGQPYTPLISVHEDSMVDLTNPAAVEWFKSYARKALAMGMDGWMDDFGEWLPYDAKLAGGEAPRQHNRYPTQWHQASRDLLSPEQLIFSRSGWLGEGKVAQIVWVGDQEADWSPWDGLPTVVPAMINLGLSGGIAWVTHDIAGFTGGPSTKELYLRWIELGAFTPIMRTHEGLNAERNWNWDKDEETKKAFARFAKIHRALADTWWRLGEQHRATGLPIVRALVLGWPDDPRAVSIADQYTIGDELLVAPVLTAGATTRTVYFPRGTWYDVWDPSKSYVGPREAVVDAPLGRPPVFATTPRTDLKAIQ